MANFLVLLTAVQLQVGPLDVYVRVVDVGPGLCTVTAVPDGHYMVYDAGHWQGTHCLEAVRDIVLGEEIDLLVISHSDSDHLGNAAAILAEYNIHHIITTGDRRGTNAWTAMDSAIAAEVRHGASVWNLQTLPLTAGQRLKLGEATVTLMAGWHEWTGPGLTEAERNNAISIVARLEYRGKSVLYGGDTVGRKIGDAVDVCGHAEKIMVDNVVAVALKADVMIAPHHGADNASARCFLAAVNPTFVVFSAGHRFGHPTNAAAQRYRNQGVVLANMLRTDRGDDEGAGEWAAGRVAGCQDRAGDDDVEIVLRGTSVVEATYRQVATGC